MSEPVAYLKGEYVPASQCVLPVYDLGIVLGAAVTDFMRTFSQEPYRMEDHVRRFYRSCKYARIEPPVPLEESLAISRTLIAANAPLVPGRELGLVYYMTAGENSVYAGAAGLSDGLSPTYVQHTFPLPFSLWRGVFVDGIHCVTPAPRHWPPQCLSSKIKNRNRLHMWIGEQDIQTYDAVNADEAWTPTTPYCLGPVVRINGVPIGDGKPGPMWRCILDRWSDVVGLDIYRQVTQCI